MNLRGKQPFIYAGTIGTTVTKLAAWSFDSMFLANDSANSVYYSTAGAAGPFQRIAPAEVIVFDRFVDGEGLWTYAGGAGSAIRVTLWDQRG